MTKTFAKKIADMINESSRTGILPKHFLEGDISMLYKKGDREDPRNYRPITLLNSDYKIYTRVLVHRLIKWYMSLWRSVKKDLSRTRS